MSGLWRGTASVARRELRFYFLSPLAYVFIVIFLVLAGSLTFQLGAFMERGQADLEPFFSFHPWLYLFLAPAVSMRLWAEERRSGSLEFLMTLPIPAAAAVLGKFLAAWLFLGVALALTFPMWVTVNILGEPDNGVIAASYFASWLMAGGYLALGACVSALTRNQVIAFVLGAALCFFFLMSGLEAVRGLFEGWLPPILAEGLSQLSFLANFQGMLRGLVEARDLIFFLSVIAAALLVNLAIVEMRRGE